MWQALLVGVIVLVAALYAVWALTPAVTRLRMARAIAERAHRRNGPGWLARLGAALESSARRGGCEDCSASQPLKRTPGSDRDRGR